MIMSRITFIYMNETTKVEVSPIVNKKFNWSCYCCALIMTGLNTASIT
jgi:hypothetical protein